MTASTAPALEIRRLKPLAKLPTKAHANDLGWDLYAAEAVSIAPGSLAKISTGIAIAFPADIGGIVKDRSSLAAKGLHALAGVIDPDYRGEIMIVCANLGSAPIEIQAGDRCAQMILVQSIAATVHEADVIANTVRGAGGFGSTGR